MATPAMVETEERKALRLMWKRDELMYCKQSVSNGRNFPVRDTDVFIATYPKCGTTWVTAICHALRTRGNEDFQNFDEITEVVPWDVFAMKCGQDLSADQIAEPRLIKSHETWGDIAKGGRYIYVCRTPADALISFYHFFPDYTCCNDGTISLDGYFADILSDASLPSSIWNHYVDWIQAALAMPDKILVLTYEDLKRDPRREIERIAAFLQLPDVDDEMINKVQSLTCFDYMSKHTSQFDDHFVFNKVKGDMGLSGHDIRTSKVKFGTSGRGKSELSPSVLHSLEESWTTLVRPKLGVESYEELVSEIIHSKLQGRNLA